ncbi:hypothetical protein FHW73_000912 [Luteimonas sp. RC10]|nr:hypothetical protein [Luteimonas sp. RC10]
MLLVGVNMFLLKEGGGEVATEIALVRSAEERRAQQIPNVQAWQARRSRLASQSETEFVHTTDGGGSDERFVHDG